MAGCTIVWNTVNDKIEIFLFQFFRKNTELRYTIKKNINLYFIYILDTLLAMLYTRSMVNFICKQEEKNNLKKIHDIRIEVATSILVCENQGKTVTELTILWPQMRDGIKIEMFF